jgi:hypothetical protein
LQPDEIAVLVLPSVTYRHPNIKSLEEFLTKQYGFKKIEEKEFKLSEHKTLFPKKSGKITFEKEIDASTILKDIEKEFSILKIYEGSCMDAKIRVYELGDVIQEEYIVETTKGEQFPVYTAEYQMIKLISNSGYAIQQFLERLTVDLGLGIGSKEWIFHRSRKG